MLRTYVHLYSIWKVHIRSCVCVHELTVLPSCTHSRIMVMSAHARRQPTGTTHLIEMQCTSPDGHSAMFFLCVVPHSLSCATFSVRTCGCGLACDQHVLCAPLPAHAIAIINGNLPARAGVGVRIICVVILLALLMCCYLREIWKPCRRQRTK